MESPSIAEPARTHLILAGFSIVAFFWMPALNIGMGVIAVLATVTVVQRGVHAYRVLKQKQASEQKQENQQTTVTVPQVKMKIGA